jgi:tight adherence protein B
VEPLALLTAICVGLAILMIFAGLRRSGPPRDTMTNRLDAFRGEGEAPVFQEDEPAVALKQQRSYSGLPILSSFFAQFKGSEKVALQLERAAVPLRVGEYYMIRWVAALLLFLVPFIFGVSLFNLVIAIGLAVLGYMLPQMWLNGRQKKRVDRLNAQLVDMLGMVSNSLKSGYGLMQSFEFASKQMHAPMALELRKMLRDANLGMSAEEALNALGDRINSKDMDMVLTAINIQRAVGGNLAEILDNVAFTMRERERIRGEIATLTSQQKMTGIVIGGLPVFMFVVFMVINPDYMSLLFTDFAGRIIMLAAIFLEILGYFTIKRIMAIEV